ncbi:hypothetical protein GCM10010230_24690 [Streptomyces narbonensis]|uniref:hypothetical protein n=1 Tax=Streptomyces narbonensis TaxID=67333 RepID=UPI00167BC9E8|nr:hypothetical protein [Streptomyces narbonensis]GGV99183.1 hypothetical protein GCM10010230_24690 [Streptomyces narbonensis]
MRLPVTPAMAGGTLGWVPRHLLVPVDVHVDHQSGAHVGEILVWTDRGATLAALEFAWVTDEMPTSLPAVVDDRLSRPA